MLCKNKHTVQDYLSEPVMIGGQQTTRGDFIREQRESGASHEAIDLYLSGYDMHHPPFRKEGDQ